MRGMRGNWVQKSLEEIKNKAGNENDFRKAFWEALITRVSSGSNKNSLIEGEEVKKVIRLQEKCFCEDMLSIGVSPHTLKKLDSFFIGRAEEYLTEIEASKIGSEKSVVSRGYKANDIENNLDSEPANDINNKKEASKKSGISKKKKKDTIGRGIVA